MSYLRMRTLDLTILIDRSQVKNLIKSPQFLFCIVFLLLILFFCEGGCYNFLVSNYYLTNITKLGYS